MKIVTRKNKLTKVVNPCSSVEEGEEIAKKLIEALDDFGGLGLAANQVGIDKAVCVVRARKDEEPKVLINPRCVDVSDEKVGYIEGCLSLPGKRVHTVRNKTVKIACDNWVNEIEFGPDSSELDADNYWKDEGLLECVCIQHEVGHLSGELITDDHIRLKREPVKRIKYGRNEKVMVEKDGETQFIKYKKAEALLEDGWEII
jgi:peptide deformylase